MNGTSEDYNISLRKNRNEDIGVNGFEKSNDFLFDNILVNVFSGSF